MFPILVALSFLLLTDCVIAKMVIVTATQEIEITTTTEEEVYTVFIPPKECSASRYLNYSYDPKIIHIGIEKSEFSFNVYFSYKGRKQIANLRKAFHLALHNDVPQRFFLVWTISRRILVYHLPPHSEHLKFQEFTPSTFGRYLKWEENVGGFYRNGTTYFGAGRDVYFNRTFRVGANGAYDREWCKSYGHRDVVDKHCMSNCNFQPNNVSSDTVECVYDPYSRLHFTVKRKKNPPYHWNAYYMSYACNIFLESSIYDFPTNPDVNQPASVLLHWYEPDLKDGDRLELHPEEANCYVLDGGNHILLDADWFDNPPTSCSQLNISRRF